MFICFFHPIGLPGYVFILCELILDPSAYSSSKYADKSSGIETEREVRCASTMLARADK